MFEISLFGWLIASLASGLSVLLLLAAFGSAGYLCLTIGLALLPFPSEGIRNVLRIPAGRWFAGIGAGAAVLALGVTLAGLSADNALITLLLGASLSMATGGIAALSYAVMRKVVIAVEGSQARRARALEAARREAALREEAGKRRLLEGADLRREVQGAEAALGRLRDAVGSLRNTRATLEEKLSAVPEEEQASKLAEEYNRLRDELDDRIELGQRVLEAAEAAAFRVACAEPLKRLLRRKPVLPAALVGRGEAWEVGSPEGLGQRIDAAVLAIDAFEEDVAQARAALDGLEPRKPKAIEGGENADDPVAQARREVNAIEVAYRAVRERAEVVRMRLRARAGMADVATAAGAISSSTRLMGVDEGEWQQLVEEVARAEAAMAMEEPDDGDRKALAEALERSAAALGKEDTASLDELLRAMKEIG